MMRQERGIELILSIPTILRDGARSLCPPPAANREGILRQLSAIFVTGILYSILLVSYHHHDGCVIRSDCPICKFAIDFASGDSAAEPPVLAPHFAVAVFVPQDVVCICGVCPVSLTSRAPPMSSPVRV